jgi:hypothetical protein
MDTLASVTMKWLWDTLHVLIVVWENSLNRSDRLNVHVLMFESEMWRLLGISFFGRNPIFQFLCTAFAALRPKILSTGHLRLAPVIMKLHYCMTSHLLGTLKWSGCKQWLYVREFERKGNRSSAVVKLVLLNSTGWTEENTRIDSQPGFEPMTLECELRRVASLLYRNRNGV